MKAYYLAIDIGASSGRHILGSLEDGKLVLEEVYRFDNGMIKKDGRLCWDYEQLFQDILAGIKLCKEIGKIPVSMGIDTWGVDYVLLDQEGAVLGDMVGYRDQRTDHMDEQVYRAIEEEKLYERTGIQKMLFNTIFQLVAVREQEPELLEKAESLLFVPDYFHYRLTGTKVNEYTEATTSQLINAKTRTWDTELINALGLPNRIFQRIAMPGESIGCLNKEIATEIGYDMEVVLPCTHDTQSAILAVPANDDDFVYISSGTWSLLGIERAEADCSKQSKEANFTNEGGYDNTICYLRNIMGLWMIQSVRRDLDKKYSFAQLCELAAESKAFPSRVDVSNDVFMAPENMIEAIQTYCRETGQEVPETVGEIATVVYTSLAECYARTIEKLEATTGREYKRVHIVGGGGNADYLNQLTATATGKEIHVGPTEGTAVGNLIAQMLKNKEFETKEEARSCIYRSFEMKVYQP